MMLMCKTKTKILIIFVIFAANINARNIPLDELSAGDTVNISRLSFESTAIFGDVFNGFERERFINAHDYTDSIFTLSRYHINLTLESLKYLSFLPKIYTDGMRVDVSSINMIDKSDHNNFNINMKYISNKYLFSFIEICRIMKKEKLKINVYSENDFPTIYRPISHIILYNNTGVLRFRKDNETHFVNSISTGECFSQIFVHEAKIYAFFIGTKLRAFDAKTFFTNYVHKSQIITASGNRALTEKINNQLKYSSLYNYWDSKSVFESEMLSDINKTAVIMIHLQSLPDLSALPLKEMIDNEVQLESLKPGDIVTTDGNNFYFLFNYENNTHKYKTPPMTFYNYTQCYKPEQELFTRERSSSIEAKKQEHRFKLDNFSRIIKSNNYGVDEKYLNDNYKMLKITVCSGFERKTSELISDLKIINLEEFAGNDKYNIFENKNILFFYGKNHSALHVSSIEKGDCLFQALIYPATASRSEVDNFHQMPVFRGRIMSASGDVILESWVKIFLASDPYNIWESLLNAEYDVLSVLLPIINQLSIHKELINLYLSEVDKTVKN